MQALPLRLREQTIGALNLFRAAPGRFDPADIRIGQALADVAASTHWLKSEPGIEQVAIVGFSAGGHLSYLAACRLPISLTAVLYGGWLTMVELPRG